MRKVVQLHMLLTELDRDRLKALAQLYECTATDVVRRLLRERMIELGLESTPRPGRNKA